MKIAVLNWLHSRRGDFYFTVMDEFIVLFVRKLRRKMSYTFFFSIKLNEVHAHLYFAFVFFKRNLFFDSLVYFNRRRKPSTIFLQPYSNYNTHCICVTRFVLNKKLLAHKSHHLKLLCSHRLSEFNVNSF